MINEERQVVPIGIAKGKLSRAPTRVFWLRPKTDAAARAVLRVEGIRIIDVDAYSEIPRRSLAKGIRGLPLHMQQNVPTADPGVIIRRLLVAEIQFEAELIAVVRECAVDIVNVKNHEGIAKHRSGHDSPSWLIGTWPSSSMRFCRTAASEPCHKPIAV